MTRHTAGPWKARELLKDRHSIIQRAGTWEISTPNYDVCADVPGGGPIRNEADALLIAEAPNMHEALAYIATEGTDCPANLEPAVFYRIQLLACIGVAARALAPKESK